MYSYSQDFFALLRRSSCIAQVCTALPPTFITPCVQIMLRATGCVEGERCDCSARSAERCRMLTRVASPSAPQKSAASAAHIVPTRARRVTGKRTHKQKQSQTHKAQRRHLRLHSTAAHYWRNIRTFRQITFKFMSCTSKTRTRQLETYGHVCAAAPAHQTVRRHDVLYSYKSAPPAPAELNYSSIWLFDL